MKRAARINYRILLLVPVLITILACRTFYQAAGLLPTATPTALPTATETLLPPTETALPTPSLVPTDPPPVVEVTETHPEITVTPSVPPTPMPQDLMMNVFQSLWETVRDEYLYPDYNGLDWDSVYEEYQSKVETGLTNDEFYLSMAEMIYSLGDDHSAYLSPDEVKLEDAEFEGNYNYVGIGVLMSPEPEGNRALVLTTFPGSPAEAAGLQSRDAILTADGQSILDEDGALRNIVRGPEGTQVTILVQTPGEEPRELVITRRAITSSLPVPHKVLVSPGGKRIGYVLLLTFADDNIDEYLGQALEELTAEGPLDGLIIDNTQNSGGADTVLKPTLGYFTSGNLGNFISRDGERLLRVRSAVDINGSQDVPIVVLVSKNTVSYGEVFAGVMKDIDRAYLIGETTDGNVETLWSYEFEDGSRVWLAHESFRPLNHPEEDWEQSGIIPDEEVPVRWSEFTVETDPLVLAALAYLDGR